MTLMIHNLVIYLMIRIAMDLGWDGVGGLWGTMGAEGKWGTVRVLFAAVRWRTEV